MKTSLLLTAFLLFVVVPGYAQSRGGSAYVYYADAPLIRDCYGVIKNYNESSGTINSNLAQMADDTFGDGQKKLNIMITHLRGGAADCGQSGAHGTLMNSSIFDTQYTTNLTAFVSAAMQRGFVEFVVMMAPQVYYPPAPASPILNDPRQWPTYSFGLDNGYVSENLNAIFQIRAAMINAGAFYRLVLMDEAFVPQTDPPGQPFVYTSVSQYVSTAWSVYVDSYGATEARNTGGFTVGTNGLEASQVNDLIGIYDAKGAGRPFLWVLNVICPPSLVRPRFLSFDAALDAKGEATTGIIIGSTWYNNYVMGQQISGAAADAQRTIHYLLQWFQNAIPPDGDGAYHVTVQDFGNYTAWGF